MTAVDVPIAAPPPVTAATQAYVRTAPAPPLAPPLTSVGWLGWVRANLFGSAVSTVLTLLIILLLVVIVPRAIDFLFVDAVWSGSDREACLPTPARPEVGACWAYIGDRFAYTMYGSYPIAARWRVDLFFGLLAFGTGWLLWLEAPRRDLGSIISSPCCRR
jgi:general L-amino acid transport system permease protein